MTHLDYPTLEQAIEVFNKMLNFINEYKGRRDMVSKYLEKLSTPVDYTEMNITDLVKMINLRGIKKKTMRLSYQVSTMLGLYNQQVRFLIFFSKII